MRFTPYTVACILTFSSLALSAPLSSVPNDASSLETRDTELGDKPDRRVSPYDYAPSYASKPRRNVDAEFDIERRDPKRHNTPVSGYPLRAIPGSDLWFDNYNPTPVMKGAIQPIYTNVPPTAGKGKKGKRGADAEFDVESRDLKVEELKRREPSDMMRSKPTNAPQPSHAATLTPARLEELRKAMLSLQRKEALFWATNKVKGMKGVKRDVEETIEAREADAKITKSNKYRGPAVKEPSTSCAQCRDDFGTGI